MLYKSTFCMPSIIIRVAICIVQIPVDESCIIEARCMSLVLEESSF